jgi:hypothetical protein
LASQAVTHAVQSIWTRYWRRTTSEYPFFGCSGALLPVMLSCTILPSAQAPNSAEVIYALMTVEVNCWVPVSAPAMGWYAAADDSLQTLCGLSCIG